MSCNEIDFMYPMIADIYHPIVKQDIYGQVKKDWGFDRTIVVSLNPAGSAFEEEVKPKVFVQYENMLLGRVKNDIRIGKDGTNNSITNVLLTNIRNCSGELIYKETSGAREDRGTIYEIATLEPFTGPFGNIEYYKIVVRRAENQGVDD